MNSHAVSVVFQANRQFPVSWSNYAFFGSNCQGQKCLFFGGKSADTIPQFLTRRRRDRQDRREGIMNCELCIANCALCIEDCAFPVFSVPLRDKIPKNPSAYRRYDALRTRLRFHAVPNGRRKANSLLN